MRILVNNHTQKVIIHLGENWSRARNHEYEKMLIIQVVVYHLSTTNSQGLPLAKMTRNKNIENFAHISLKKQLMILHVQINQ